MVRMVPFSFDLFVGFSDVFALFSVFFHVFPILSVWRFKMFPPCGVKPIVLELSDFQGCKAFTNVHKALMHLLSGTTGEGYQHEFIRTF